MMNRTPRHSHCAVDRQPSTAEHPRGFTFVEVLFAIIILGIGMIMLAAMLPVAISQTAQTRDQIAGKGAVEAGYAYVTVIAKSSGLIAFPETPRTADLPKTNPDAPAGMMVPATSITANTNPPGLNQYKLSRIMSSDPSVQWIPFYRRDYDARVVHFVVLATRISSNEQVKEYSAVTIKKETEMTNSRDDSPIAGLNGPHLYRISVTDSQTTAGDLDELTFYDESSGTEVNPPMAAAGTFVIVREQNDDSIADNPQVSFRNNGRVFKLISKKNEDPLDATWLLDPEYDLPAAGLGPDGVTGSPDDLIDTTLSYPTDNNKRASAWIVGRAATDPTGTAGLNTFSGVTQDIGILKFDLTLE